MEYVTVSAKIDKKLRKKLEELSIRPSEVIRRALEEEVKRKTKEMILKKIKKASPLLQRVSKEEIVRAIRESRDEH